MKLSATQCKRLAHGYVQCKEQDGWLCFYRFSDEQIEALAFDAFFQSHSKVSASVRFEWKTDAKGFSFAYKLAQVQTKDSVDVFVNGRLFCAFPVETLQGEGRIAVELPDGDKTVTVYLPTEAEMHVKDMVVDGKWRAVPEKKKKVLWIGDSITQGYGSLMSGQTLVNIVTRKRGFETLNQGLAGSRHMLATLKRLEGYTPDLLVVAMGTNDGLKDFEKAVTAFYQKLSELYPNIPVWTVTPVWRGDAPEKTEEVRLKSEKIRAVCRDYPNITLVDGFALIPHVARCYRDGVHPNAWGYELYGNGLAEILKNA